MIAACLLVIAVPGSSQELEDDPSHLWVTYRYQSRFGERIRGFGELGYEELVSDERFFGEWNRVQLKLGISFEVNRHVRVAAGLGAFHTFLPETEDAGEARLWQDAQIFWPQRNGGFRRFVLTHRLRLEERFHEADDWDLDWRFRYRLATKIAINSQDIQPGSFFVPLAAEYFFDLGDDVEEIFADRSRVSIGLGYVFDPRWLLDVRFHSERSRVGARESFRAHGSVIDFTVQTSVRIRDLVKGR